MIMKTLVIYYTREGNSKFAAEAIAAELGADIEEVIDLKNRQGTCSDEAFVGSNNDSTAGGTFTLTGDTAGRFQ